MTTTNSIAAGHVLTPENFADFVDRLKYHCKGDGVDWHSTADAIFIVECRRIIFGIDRDYTDKVAVAIDGSMWFSPLEYWNDLDQDAKDSLDAKAKEDNELSFLELDEYGQWDLLSGLDDHTVSGWDDRWDYVCAHFTKEAAEAFIERKKHDYSDGMRVYVNAQLYCWEWNAIKQALMDGRLILSESKEGEA